MLSRFNRPKFIPLIMSVSAVLLMFALGTWQVKRLYWKEALIASMEAASKEAPLTTLPVEDIEKKQFYTVRLKGTYLDNPQFHIAARYHNSELGYHVVTPFKTTKGTIVLVNRGWIPVALKKDDLSPPDGRQTIVGQIRVGAERNPFTPASQPENNMWFGRDVELMAQAGGFGTPPYMLDLVVAEPKEGVYPIAFDGHVQLRNDHLSYVIIWYTTGIGILIIALVYHRKRPNEA